MTISWGKCIRNSFSSVVITNTICNKLYFVIFKQSFLLAELISDLAFTVRIISRSCLQKYMSFEYMYKFLGTDSASTYQNVQEIVEVFFPQQNSSFFYSVVLCNYWSFTDWCVSSLIGHEVFNLMYRSLINSKENATDTVEKYEYLPLLQIFKIKYAILAASTVQMLESSGRR